MGVWLSPVLFLPHSLARGTSFFPWISPASSTWAPFSCCSDLASTPARTVFPERRCVPAAPAPGCVRAPPCSGLPPRPVLPCQVPCPSNIQLAPLSRNATLLSFCDLSSPPLAPSQRSAEPPWAEVGLEFRSSCLCRCSTAHSVSPSYMSWARPPCPGGFRAGPR